MTSDPESLKLKLKDEERFSPQNPNERLIMKNVFAVLECVDYEGEYIRGIYSSNKEAESRKKYLEDNEKFKVDYEVRELAVDVDVDII